MKWGTYVVFSNSYFTLRDDPAFPDVRINICPRWTKEGELGTKFMSKTILCSSYGEDKATPRVISYLVLRAWMLYRFQWFDFHMKRSVRRRWLAEETAKLRAHIEALAHPSGGTGCKCADRAIRKWAGDALK